MARRAPVLSRVISFIYLRDSGRCRRNAPLPLEENKCASRGRGEGDALKRKIALTLALSQRAQRERNQISMPVTSYPRTGGVTGMANEHIALPSRGTAGYTWHTSEYLC